MMLSALCVIIFLVSIVVILLIIKNKDIKNVTAQLGLTGLKISLDFYKHQKDRAS